MMKILCSIALILLSFGVFAQKNITGIGLINFGIGHELTIHTQRPDTLKSEINLYTSLYEKPTACIQKKLVEWGFYATSIIDNQDVDSVIDYYTSGLVWTAYKTMSIQYYEEKDGFVKVKINKKNYWISLDELTAIGRKATLWKDYFKEHNYGSIQVIYNMNLRINPNANSDKIMLIEKNSKHLITILGNFEGNWAEIEVRIWEGENDYCDATTRDNYRTVIGWIKYLDDKGFPNLFAVPTPCC